MCRHEDKHCQRCGTSFECKVGNITQCQCYGVNLNNEEQQFISKQFSDCLCFACIKALRTQFNTAEFSNGIKKYAGH
ncbi:MAG: cysteine-rich CWC family protein [Ferruginibacter sp.]